jgi:hypothetical protein
MEQSAIQEFHAPGYAALYPGYDWLDTAPPHRSLDGAESGIREPHYPTENRYTVVCVYLCPGLSTVVGN